MHSLAHRIRYFSRCRLKCKICLFLPPGVLTLPGLLLAAVPSVVVVVVVVVVVLRLPGKKVPTMMVILISTTLKRNQPHQKT